MLNFNIFENIDIICKCFGLEDKKIKRKSHSSKFIEDIVSDSKISILPISPNFDIDNLYPITNHVQLWNIFVVGSDKTYIMANIKDQHIKFNKSDDLLNRKGSNILPEELNEMFDSIWERTLKGNRLQFYMVICGKLYFINTYPFINDKQKINGGIMFMRSFDIMPPVESDNISINDNRISLDKKEQSPRASNERK